MKIINEYNQYCQYLKRLPTTKCLRSEMFNRVAHRSEAALAILWKKGLLKEITNKGYLLFLSIENRIEIYSVKYVISADSSKQHTFDISSLPIPTVLSDLYDSLGQLFSVQRTQKWWEMCFKAQHDVPSSNIKYDEKYDELNVNDTSELHFGQLLSLCRKAVSTFVSATSDKNEMVVLAEDNRVLPLVYAMQKIASTSMLILQSLFEECNDILLGDFRKAMCSPPLPHKVCLMSAAPEFNLHYSYLLSDTEQLIYVPAEANMETLSLLPNLSLSRLFNNPVPNIEISGVKYMCFSVLSTTDIFGQTVVRLNLSETQGYILVLLPDGEMVDRDSPQNLHDENNAVVTMSANDTGVPMVDIKSLE